MTYTTSTTDRGSGSSAVMTKKLLVAFDPKCTEAKSSDFLAPVWEGETPRLLGLKSGKLHKYGLVVFVGRDFTANDLFAKLVDAGRKVESVDRVLAELGAYLGMVKVRRIGEVLSVEAAPDEAIGFALQQTNLKASPGHSW